MKSFVSFSFFWSLIALILLVQITKAVPETINSKDNFEPASQSTYDLKNKTAVIEQLLNYCIDSKNHKSNPGPEDGLHHQCSPWKDRSCCTSTTTVAAHYTNMYNFEWDHCSHVSPLSDKCRRHFVQDLCFYECSPNVGPWAVKINQKFRKERFMDVPLCATDCDNWFNDCLDDVTCTDNWGRNFDWVGGVNKCPIGSTCSKFSQVFKSSKEFCEIIWDHSWKYTPNEERCMRLWFNSSYGNPNDGVAAWKAQQLVSGGEGRTNLFFGSTKYTYTKLMSLTLFPLVTIKYIY